MIPALLLGLALAAPDHTERLLGDTPSGAETEAIAGLPAGAPPAPSIGWWSVPATILVLGAAGWVRRRQQGASLTSTAAVKVMGQAAMPHGGSLVVVEVADADGRSRRLLVGTVGGAPRLVAELDNPMDRFESTLDDVSEGQRRANSLIGEILDSRRHHEVG